MNDHLITEIKDDMAEIGARLADEARSNWVAAVADAEQAYRWWCTSTAEDRDLRYAAYHAALDREEAAARDLERLGRLERSMANA